MSLSSRSTRSSISPFRSRSSAAAGGAPERRRTTGNSSSVNGRPTTPSSSSSFSSRPASAGGRPTTPSTFSAGRPVTPSSVSSRPATSRGSKSSATPPPVPAAAIPSEPVNVNENITVTVRFRPLSQREIDRGDEIAWYADGDCTVRNEHNQSIAYSYDRVFGPATTTRQVYDVAAQHIVAGAMEGINGTVFAYGVTSSGKTHTMHGEQKSPGIIPLAVKDVFSIIQDTPGREFLLRVSYLEIYNEVINDLLDPTGQNLRIREDSQGIYVEGIKEEVVLSPAHALSLIASGEEHRHVGSNNFNLVSSRSHTIFTLTIESSPSAENEDEEVRLSQLNLIDLAGSESSKTETTGLRRKEGSYINKSLLTLGTVISKLTDAKATHIPFRDSKLTRLLQSSLSGYGRISLICNITPASSNTEETHNTLKFAQRSKNVEVKASQNKILDEKSLIKKYQKEITSLREELQHLRSRMMAQPYIVTNQEDLASIKHELEAGQVNTLRSRLEEEEEAKAALMGRIQRLEKLILVSSKNSILSDKSEKYCHKRRHSFGEDELAYLPDRRQDSTYDDDDISVNSEFSMEAKLDASNLNGSISVDGKNQRHSMLGWLKLKKHEQRPCVDGEGNANASIQSSQQKQLASGQEERRNSVGRKVSSPLVESVAERTQAGDLFSVTTKGRHILENGTTIGDQIDLLHEQVKMLAGEVALSTSSLKRLSDQAANSPNDRQIQGQIENLTKSINEKKLHISALEQRMIASLDSTECSSNSIALSQTLSRLTAQLNEVTFQLELTSADNRVLQDQLKAKASENAELLSVIAQLRQEVAAFSELGSNPQGRANIFPKVTEGAPSFSVNSNRNQFVEQKIERELKSQILMQATEIESWKQENLFLAEEKAGLEVEVQKLAEESSYAKELAAAAAVEVKNLVSQVTRLSYENSRLSTELAAAKEFSASLTTSQTSDEKDRQEQENYILVEELQKELIASCQREASLETELAEKVQVENELMRSLDDAKHRELDLKNELANMYLLVSHLKKSSSGEKPLEGSDNFDLISKQNGCYFSNSIDNGLLHGVMISESQGTGTREEAVAAYNYQKRRCQELESIISRLKAEDIGGLDSENLEELQNFHLDALSRICQEKLRIHEM